MIVPLDVDIRVLTASDAEAFRFVRLEALQECPTAFTADYAANKDRPLRFFAGQIESTPDRFVLGGFAAQKLVAIVGFFRSEGPKLWHRGHVWTLYVAPAARRQGVGRRMLDAVVARARAMPELAQINLSVVIDRPEARRLYLTFGFVAVGREPRAVRVGTEFYDEESMVLSLAPVV